MAMGLASFNPMVGAMNRGNIMINSMCPEKDAQFGDFSISKTLDSDDNRLTVDDNGKLCIKNKDDLKNNKLNAFYITTENAEGIFESLVEEATLPYNHRPIRSKSFLYEVFTGHSLLTPDQAQYDPLLEEIELDKFSKVISGDAENIKKQYDTEKTKKDGSYIPDGKFPVSGVTENTRADQIVQETNISYLSIYQDEFGLVYGLNEYTGAETIHCYSVDDIDLSEIINV